jgi:hypothetical protein
MAILWRVKRATSESMQTEIVLVSDARHLQNKCSLLLVVLLVTVPMVNATQWMHVTHSTPYLRENLSTI